jgi:hypothetical protein
MTLILGGLTDAELRAAPIETVIAQGSQLDTAGAPRASKRTIVFEITGTYDDNPLIIEDVPTGTGLSTYNTLDGSITLSTGGTASGARMIRQSYQYMIYTAGNGRQMIAGCGFGAPATNVRRRFGLFDNDNGLFLEQTLTGYRFVIRSNSSGAPVDAQFEQAAWEDKFDGSGASGITLDLSRIQGFVFEFFGYNGIYIRFGFFLNGQMYYAKIVSNTNAAVPTGLATGTLPYRAEIENTGVALATATMTTTTAVCYDEDGDSDDFFLEYSASMGVTSVAVTTRRPILTIRPKANWNGKVNRGHVHLEHASLVAKTNDCLIEIIRNGVLTGASYKSAGTRVTAGAFIVGKEYVIISIGTTDFTLIGAASNTIGIEFTATGVGAGTGVAATNVSHTEFDTAATAITGGEQIFQDYGISGSGATAAKVGGDIDSKFGLFNNYAGTGTDTLTLVITSLTGTSNVIAAMNFKEQR